MGITLTINTVYKIRPSMKRHCQWPFSTCCYRDVSSVRNLQQAQSILGAGMGESISKNSGNPDDI